MRNSYGIRFRKNVWAKLEKHRQKGGGIVSTTNEAIDAYINENGGRKRARKNTKDN